MKFFSTYTPLRKWIPQTSWLYNEHILVSLLLKLLYIQLLNAIYRVFGWLEVLALASLRNSLALEKPLNFFTSKFSFCFILENAYCFLSISESGMLDMILSWNFFFMAKRQKETKKKTKYLLTVFICMFLIFVSQIRPHLWNDLICELAGNRIFACKAGIFMWRVFGRHQICFVPLYNQLY